ncbi:hypothetical protein BX600DRAFT_505753 [Xylariales sp. PMI_506]|nr:hypothetical protein BX600DRAFT_505753 [Xylariales sp. PMI_506]
MGAKLENEGWEKVGEEQATTVLATAEWDRKPRLDGADSSRLQVLGATWGGVNVTIDVRDMVSAQQSLDFDMATVYKILQPDPAPGTTKMLTVLYRYGSHGDLCLLNVSEDSRVRTFTISPHAHDFVAVVERLTPRTQSRRRQQQRQDQGQDQDPDQLVPPPPYQPSYFRSESGAVEILAVTYGNRRIETPSVLRELGLFFEGRRGQIRMTNYFFKIDPWEGHRKTWSVFFRFVGLGPEVVQCVTGPEDGALEVPWVRG